MLSLLVYSGKGGVGKTTVTYCLYKAFKAAGHNVAVLDMDLNTPSFHLLDNSDDVVSATENLGLFIDTAQINNFIKVAKRKIKALAPDILLIDSPPSITHIHYTLMEKLDLSGVVLVTQPTALSISDVEKTVPFFEQKGITVTGIVENMSLGNELEYRYPKLASIPRTDTFDSHFVYEQNIDKFAALADTLLAMDLTAASLENRKAQLFDESITMASVRSMYGIHGDEDTGCHFDGSKKNTVKNIKFVNLSTWEELRNIVMEVDYVGRGLLNMMPMASFTDALSEATYDKVARLLKAFEEDDKAMFMICRHVSLTPSTVMGEVGYCNLIIKDSHYGIPCVEYQTAGASITLFPHEVMPVDQETIDLCIQDGYTYIENGSRMLPPLELAQQLTYMDNGCDISDRWQRLYDSAQPKPKKTTTV